MYVMEVILLYILLTLLYIHTEVLPPILPFVFITLGGALLIAFLLSLMKSNTPYFFIILTIPLLALVSSEIGLGFGVSLVLAAVVCYRIVIHTQKTPKLTESILLNISMLSAGLVFFAAKVQGYVYSDIILYLVVTQLLFFMLGKIMSGVLNSTLISKEKEVKKQSWSMIGIFGGLLGGAVILSVLFPIIFVKGLSFIASLIGKGLYFVSTPLFNAVDSIDYSARSRGESVGSINWPENEEEKMTWIERLATFDIWMVLSIIGLLILAVLIFLIARKRLVKEPVVVADSFQYATTTQSVDTPSRKWQRVKRQTPQAKVRKLILELEILSANKGLGRYHHENVTEWLGRNNFLDVRLVELYERVRYGDEELTEEENQACEEIVKQVKNNIRSLKKNKDK